MGYLLFFVFRFHDELRSVVGLKIRWRAQPASYLDGKNCSKFYFPFCREIATVRKVPQFTEPFSRYRQAEKKQRKPTNKFFCFAVFLVYEICQRRKWQKNHPRSFQKSILKRLEGLSCVVASGSPLSLKYFTTVNPKLSAAFHKRRMDIKRARRKPCKQDEPFEFGNKRILRGTFGISVEANADFMLWLCEGLILTCGRK